MKTFRFYGKLAVLCFLLYPALASCTAGQADEMVTPIPEHFQDRSLLTKSPCAPPCWFGLTPGEAGQTDVLLTVEGLQFLDSESIVISPASYLDVATQNRVNGTAVVVDCVLPAGKQCVRFVLANDLLRFIEVELNYEATFEDVVTWLGEPDYFSVIPSGTRFVCNIELTWVKERVTVSHFEYIYEDAVELCQSISNGGKVNPDLGVNYIYYSESSWIAGVLELEGTHVWTGFY